jgi:hypothetical protein
MTRRGIYRGLYSSLIDDVDYQRLTPPARLVLLTLRLCTQAGAAAIFRVYVVLLAEQTGLEVLEVEKALSELAGSPSPEKPWIYRDGPVVWVRNGLRYDPTLRLSDEKHKKSIERAVAALPQLPIVASFCRYYQITSPFDGSGEGLGGRSEDLSPPSTESEVLPETEIQPEAEAEREVRASSPNGGSHPPHSRPGLREVRL